MSAAAAGAVVFVGPTLGRDEVAALIDAECRPPAAQGDVYRAALGRPAAIGIIDGFFDGVPSVWHTEILWAMAEGLPVDGRASMGALRAAELCAFGMRGVGRIFEAYRDGALEDDDEVAVLHAPAELGFRPLSEPMVSIRATLDKAGAEAVLPADELAAVTRAAKLLNYRDRGWERILGVAGLSPDATEVLRNWLPEGRVDAKREDAVAMLRAMAAEEAEPAPAPGYSFEWTNVWNGLAARVGAELTADADTSGLVLDELRLDRDLYEALGRRAALRRLALEEARRLDLDVERRDLLDEISRHRTRHGLHRRSDLTAWLVANGISEHHYEALTRESREIGLVASQAPKALARHILAELKWSGDYARLNRRARDKAEALAGSPSNGPGPGSAGPGRLNLALWYFEKRLGEPVPDDLDGYARSIGLDSRRDLYRLIEREHLYCRMQEGDSESDETILK